MQLMRLRTNKKKGLREWQNKREEFLTNTYGPKGKPQRDDYEKLTSGQLFKSKYFKVSMFWENKSLDF